MHIRFRTTDGRARRVVVLSGAFSISPRADPGKRFELILDTGADITMLPRNILDLHEPCIRGDKVTISFIGNCKGERTYKGTLHLFSGDELFGEFCTEDGFVPVDTDYGFLGMDIIRELVIVLNFPTATILRR